MSLSTLAEATGYEASFTTDGVNDTDLVTSHRDVPGTLPHVSPLESSKHHGHKSEREKELVKQARVTVPHARGYTDVGTMNMGRFFDSTLNKTNGRSQLGQVLSFPEGDYRKQVYPYHARYF